jgi:hypothetical protein
MATRTSSQYITAVSTECYNLNHRIDVSTATSPDQTPKAQFRMSSTQQQRPIGHVSPGNAPVTWQKVMEMRRDKGDSTYFPIERLPQSIRQWYPFGRELQPPGVVASRGEHTFRMHAYEDLIRERIDFAWSWACTAMMPWRFNMTTGTIDLNPEFLEPWVPDLDRIFIPSLVGKRET